MSAPMYGLAAMLMGVLCVLCLGGSKRWSEEPGWRAKFTAIAVLGVALTFLVLSTALMLEATR